MNRDDRLSIGRNCALTAVGIHAERIWGNDTPQFHAAVDLANKDERFQEVVSLLADVMSSIEEKLQAHPPADDHVPDTAFIEEDDA